MSFKREGDDTAWLNIIQRRRVSELLSEDIPADEAMLTKNGRLACLVCPHRPVVDNLSILSVHRGGKKHAEHAVRFYAKKEELELLKAGIGQQSSYSDKSSMTSGTAHKDVNDPSPQLLAYSCNYNSRSCHRGERPYERRKVIDVPASCGEGAGTDSSGQGSVRQCGVEAMNQPTVETLMQTTIGAVKQSNGQGAGKQWDVGAMAQCSHAKGQITSKTGSNKAFDKPFTSDCTKHLTADSRTDHNRTLFDGAHCPKKLKQSDSTITFKPRPGNTEAGKLSGDVVGDILRPDKQFNTSQYWRRKNMKLEECSIASKLLKKSNLASKNKKHEDSARAPRLLQSYNSSDTANIVNVTGASNSKPSPSELLLLKRESNTMKSVSTCSSISDTLVQDSKTVCNKNNNESDAISRWDVKQYVIGQASSTNDSVQSERKKLYLQAISSGWKRDRGGAWIKDEEAEFESDEDTPTVS